jgi:hypothetical protein
MKIISRCIESGEFQIFLDPEMGKLENEGNDDACQCQQGARYDNI